MIPFFLDLKDFNVAVFGYGDVSKRRISKILEGGAKIDIYSLENVEISEEYAYKDISYKNCDITKLTDQELEDLIKKYDIIVTSIDKKNNERIVKISKNLKKMISSSTFESEINFIIPAYYKKDDICFSIYTGGKSPLIAREIRKLVQNYLTDNELEIEIQEKVRKLLKSNDKTENKIKNENNPVCDTNIFKNQSGRKEILELAFNDENFKRKILNLINEYSKNKNK
ncbi:precorrin-2 dehydrogenase/sirohydrochlorin ferrochelatase [Methanococcus voltae]|uniref:precorrin-2 dehydrogenase/sirohydrochlorin ferrochelatase family protein n=1 Tax=Methanococcus voltae TaxID=2188 RepID=UPI001AE1D4E1|nr:NAD(P)-dependent oxidoreductase [Methanococcus voltae]MBP2144327.1 precorrin-2 dehydrogenase/sirohydrochlorin ferrochelatase [Methanococcus voltae]